MLVKKILKSSLIIEVGLVPGAINIRLKFFSYNGIFLLDMKLKSTKKNRTYKETNIVLLYTKTHFHDLKGLFPNLNGVKILA